MVQPLFTCAYTFPCVHTDTVRTYTKDTAKLVAMFVCRYLITTHPVKCFIVCMYTCTHISHTCIHARTHARTHTRTHTDAHLHSHLPSHPASSRGSVCLHWHRPSTPAHPSHALQLEGASAPGRRRKRGGESVGNIHDTRIYIRTLCAQAGVDNRYTYSWCKWQANIYVCTILFLMSQWVSYSIYTSCSAYKVKR